MLSFLSVIDSFILVNKFILLTKQTRVPVGIGNGNSRYPSVGLITNNH